MPNSISNPDIKNWPVTTGCSTEISRGCYSCPSYWEYLEQGWDYSLKMDSSVLDMPLRNPNPSTYSVAFGSDLFHADTSDKFIQSVFAIMNQARWHTFELATKRIKRVVEINKHVKWSDNIMLGVAIEVGEYKWRIDELRKTSAHFKFLSMAPLIGDMGSMDLHGIDMVGAVRETWGYKRPCKDEWIVNVATQCKEQDVKFTLDHYTYEYEVEVA